MHNSAAPYDGKLPMLAVDIKVHEMYHFLLGTASKQLTINPKDGKKGLLRDPREGLFSMFRVDC